MPFTGTSQNSVFIAFKSNKSRAGYYYSHQGYLEAAKLYKKVIRKDSNDFMSMLNLADCYMKLNETEQAVYWYEILNQNNILNTKEKIKYAQCLLSNGKIEQSKILFSITENDLSSDSLAANKIKGIHNYRNFFADSLKYPVKPVNINTDNAECCPVYYSNGIVFLSTRDNGFLSQRKWNRQQQDFYDLYFAEADSSGNLFEPRIFDKQINSKLNEGPLSFSNEGNRIVFTRNATSFISPSIYPEDNKLILCSSEKISTGEWSNAKPLPINNKNNSFAHPTLSNDGSTMYFVSDKAGGFGGTDIYVSYFRDGQWTDPVNAGAEINTSGNEMFPYLYRDSVLFFSSDGHPGLGGLDLYRSDLINGKLTIPHNVGYPVNSAKDDFGLAINESGDKGYFSSNRIKGGTDDDIFSFEVVTVEVKGIVRGRLKQDTLNDVKLKLVHAGNCRQELMIKDGKVNLRLDPGKDYKVKLSKEGYRTVTMPISTREYKKGEIKKVVLEMDKEDKAFVNGMVMGGKEEDMSNTEIYYRDVTSGKINKVMTDKSGEFNCEIDPENDYVFFAVKENRYGAMTLKNSGKKNVLFYVNLELKPQPSGTVEGIIRRKNKALSDTEMEIRNQMTGEIQIVCSDKEGKFSYPSLALPYTITIKNHDGKTIHQQEIIPEIGQKVVMEIRVE